MELLVAALEIGIGSVAECRRRLAGDHIRHLKPVLGEPLHRLIQRQPEDPHQLLLEKERQESIGLDRSHLVAIRGARRGLASFTHPFEDAIHHLPR